MEWKNGRNRKRKMWPQIHRKLLADTLIDCLTLFQRAGHMWQHRNICAIHNNLWNENLPLAPHLWEPWVGFIQGVRARIHSMGQFLLQQTMDRGCVTDAESENEADEQQKN